MKILFMCVANSARSQMAEGLARKILGPSYEVQSAGSHPKSVHPLAQEVLAEVGIDASSQYSKSIQDLPPAFLSQVNYVITLCAEEVCPVLSSTQATRLHWPLPDPADDLGTQESQRACFREIRDQLEKRILEFSSRTL